ncbi:MAG TPA: hypothetical protein VHX86_07660 [Tepidisphaeraceae bacterium]|nr:hypothetical protein [Tepidisphaeraceae bacterium]
MVRLFHPLSDRWEEHFILNDDGTIGGNTPIGRATAIALAMNDPWPRSARAMQIGAGWLTPQA